MEWFVVWMPNYALIPPTTLLLHFSQLASVCSGSLKRRDVLYQFFLQVRLAVDMPIGIELIILSALTLLRKPAATILTWYIRPQLSPVERKRVTIRKKMFISQDQKSDILQSLSTLMSYSHV
jgi:hypothetical protein